MESSFPSEISILQSEVPKETWWGCIDLYNWEGFWYAYAGGFNYLSAAIAARKNFQALDDDVFLTSSMKTGTTWLKAIISTIMNPNGRTDNDSDDPLLKHHPTELIPLLENQFKENPNPDLSTLPSPRLFQTHSPYSMLPDSVKSSACKIVYITRDPKDTFVSLWHYINSWVSDIGKPPCPMNEAFDSFCKGVHPTGPFHDHVLSYWNQSLKRPEKILFLRYEELKKEPKVQLKKLAAFLGRPFANDEEVEKVIWRCSLERIKNLEVNQHGSESGVGASYKSYFRRGNVGDWKDSLTEEMKERLDQVTAIKFEGSGLDFGH